MLLKSIIVIIFIIILTSCSTNSDFSDRAFKDYQELEKQEYVKEIIKAYHIGLQHCVIVNKDEFSEDI